MQVAVLLQVSSSSIVIIILQFAPYAHEYIYNICKWPRTACVTSQFLRCIEVFLLEWVA